LDEEERRKKDFGREDDRRRQKDLAEKRRREAEEIERSAKEQKDYERKMEEERVSRERAEEERIKKEEMERLAAEEKERKRNMRKFNLQDAARAEYKEMVRYMQNKKFGKKLWAAFDVDEDGTMKPQEVDDFIEAIVDEFKVKVVKKALAPSPIGFDYPTIKNKLKPAIEVGEPLDYD